MTQALLTGSDAYNVVMDRLGPRITAALKACSMDLSSRELYRLRETVLKPKWFVCRDIDYTLAFFDGAAEITGDCHSTSLLHNVRHAYYAVYLMAADASRKDGEQLLSATARALDNLVTNVVICLEGQAETLKKLQQDAKAPVVAG